METLTVFSVPLDKANDFSNHESLAVSAPFPIFFVAFRIVLGEVTVHPDSDSSLFINAD